MRSPKPSTVPWNPCRASQTLRCNESPGWSGSRPPPTRSSSRSGSPSWNVCTDDRRRRRASHRRGAERAGSRPVSQSALDSIPGVTRVALPIGVNAIESVNMYVMADGDKVTVVDCGVWRPDLPDGGLAAMEAGLESAGYALQDVSRVIVTHAHIDHYGLAGRVMELTGADLSMHTMTDLDCEKYRHPDTSRSRRKDTYADHGIPEDGEGEHGEHLARWMPFLHSVVEASTRLQ